MWKYTRRRLLPSSPSSTDIKAAFTVLGVTYNPYVPRATLNEQVRKNYRELARLHHPDLSSGDDSRMKVINAAYELIQTSGVVHETALESDSVKGTTSESSPATGETGAQGSRFARKAGSRRHRMPDDFASGDEEGSPLSWAMKSSLDWQSWMNSSESLPKQELQNPANHPFSHSRFFTFDEDLTIYKMIRGGATLPQVARTLGKPTTFIEKRLHNTQFKLRVQYVLRGEKRRHGGNGNTSRPTKKHGGDQAQGPTPAAPSVPCACEPLLKRSPYDEAVVDRVAASPTHTRFPSEGRPYGTPARSGKYAQRGSKKAEWEATMPLWESPRPFADMSLEEKGRHAKLIDDSRHGHDDRAYDPVWGTEAASAHPPTRPQSASKVSRSYANYARLRGGKGARRGHPSSSSSRD